MPVHPGNESVAGGRFQLLKDVMHVVFDGAHTDMEMVGNFSILESLTDEGKHFLLPYSKSLMDLFQGG
jgi:folylpolyglutamate synthase/dihydropteroate synthase